MDPLLVLEINLISAQGLKPPSANLRQMKTYAVVRINRNTKLRTRVDSIGGETPNWNDKFLFRVSDGFVYGETSAVDIVIFGVGYVKDFVIGTVRFLLSTCLKRSSETPAFSAVQIRRPCGRFEGILNIAAAAYRSPNYPLLERFPAVSFPVLMKKNQRELRLLSRGGDPCDSSEVGVSLKESDRFREMAGKMKKQRSVGGGLLCGLKTQRIMSCRPSDESPVPVRIF